VKVLGVGIQAVKKESTTKKPLKLFYLVGPYLAGPYWPNFWRLAK